MLPSASAPVSDSNEAGAPDPAVLRREPDYTSAILAGMRVPLLVLDGALRVQTASCAFYKQFQLTPAETEGGCIFDLGDRRWDIPALRTLLEEVLPRENIVAAYELSHAFDPLGPRILRLDARRLCPAAGREPLIVLSIEDVTEQRAAAEALRASEERFRAAVSTVSSLIWTNSAEGKMEGEQPGWGNFTGQTQAEYQGYGWATAVHPEDSQPTIDAWGQAVAEKKMFVFEHRVRRADGEWRRCSVRAAPLLGKDGSIREWVGVHTDITESREAEEALRAGEEFRRSIIDSSPDCIKVLDLEGHLLSLEAGQSLLGIPDIVPYLHTPWIDFWVKDEDRAAARAAVAAAARGSEGRFVGFFRTLHGLDKWWSVVITPILDAAGRPARLLAVSRDVTEQRTLENTLVARAEQLAQADRSKDEFLAMLAHELRNPLAPLRNAAEILEAPGVSAGERDQAQRIIGRQIENMSRMIDDLLDVSRITEGKIELRKSPVALEAILTAATSLARSVCAARGQHLALSMPAEPVFLEADATRLEQVFSNLLGNASKYGGDGCHIMFRAERRGPEILVTVQDDGAGIAPELLPRVFDLFVQASRALDRSHGGLGIGLTLVQRLVKLHGGSVEARSEGLGKGAEFLVRLPILTQAPRRAPLPPPPIARAVPRRLLIVDDNTDSARSLATLQARRGHVTRTAFTGPEALGVAAEFIPEVVLLDIGLPGMDGFEVARQLRAMPALAGVLLIAMTGYASTDDRAQAREAGFDEHLVKPIDLGVLREWLAVHPRLVARGGQAGDLPRSR